MDHEQEQRQLERLSFFSDAVFAIAITLLVVEVHAPHIHPVSEHSLGQALLDLLPSYIGFIVSFFVLGRFWIAHHNMFGSLRAADGRLIRTNLLLLFVVAFMPFPTAVVSNYATMKVAVGFYAGWLTLLGILNQQLARVALRDRRLVREDVDATTIARHLRNTWNPICLGLLAFALGMVQPWLAIIGLTIGSPIIGYVIRLLPLRAPVE